MTLFDYTNQAWIQAGRYVRCGHPESSACGCYGRLHAGELVPEHVMAEAATNAAANERPRWDRYRREQR